MLGPHQIWNPLTIVITLCAPKRLHFKFYDMRVALAQLHWNENCRRARKKVDDRRRDKNDNHSRGKRYKLAPQTFKFREEIIDHLFNGSL